MALDRRAQQLRDSNVETPPTEPTPEPTPTPEPEPEPTPEPEPAPEPTKPRKR